MRDDRKADCAACETAPNGPEHQTIRGDEVKDDATMPIGPQRGWVDHAVADDDRRLMSAIERLQAVGFTVYRTAISGDRRLILTQWASIAQDLSVTSAPCTNASKWDQKRLRGRRSQMQPLRWIAAQRRLKLRSPVGLVGRRPA